MKKLLFVFVLSAVIAACGNNAPKEETLTEKIARLEQPDSSIEESKRIAELASAYLTYADSLPQSDSTPKYLYKAGYLTISTGDYMGGIRIYDRFLKQFKNHEKCPEVIWSMGATYENGLKEYGKAAECYQRIMDEYPNHKLAKDAENAKRFVGREPTAEEIEEIMKQAEAGSTSDENTTVQ